jgi:hypothetical protein
LVLDREHERCVEEDRRPAWKQRQPDEDQPKGALDIVDCTGDIELLPVR